MPESHDQEKSGAPGKLELVRAFINTHDAEHQTERLSSPRELEVWLEEAGLAQGAKASDGDVARVVELREALRALLMREDTREAEARLNEALSGASAEIRFENGGAVMIPRGETLDAALARLAMIVRDAMESGEWERLKVCRADDCLWAFYDRSRNRSRAWCDMQDCGNRAKVRAFRQRQSR